VGRRPVGATRHSPPAGRASLPRVPPLAPVAAVVGPPPGILVWEKYWGGAVAAVVGGAPLGSRAKKKYRRGSVATVVGGALLGIPRQAAGAAPARKQYRRGAGSGGSHSQETGAARARNEYRREACSCCRRRPAARATNAYGRGSGSGAVAAVGLLCPGAGAEAHGEHAGPQGERRSI
jgi:hypothetical protein